MLNTAFTFQGQENKNIYVYKWDTDKDVKGIVQIAHGMAETAARYERFAKYLNKNGYIVYANDHRGHGKSVNNIKELGYLGENNGFASMVEDMNTLNNIIKEKEHNKLPIYLFGHSMGSFLSQKYIEVYGEDLKGVILSGTNGKQGSIINLGILVAKLEMKIKGRKHKSKMLDNLSFGGYNKTFKPNRTNFDWLSRDEKEVDKYVDNKYCGTVFTSSYFYDFLKGLKSIWREENINKINKTLPIFILAGDKDPVGDSGKGIINLYNLYKNIGIEDVEYKLYKGGRHEMLNEINRDEVFEDINKWLSVH
ncbi:lysophospholipase [Clostridium oceanicum]|uniref:Alpha/beta hydrolase n=1 Tax=Clostridium oceanicum TaxID=1543 RepID=A0ABN1JGU1_9CLOT